jgi:hypothetical protein
MSSPFTEYASRFECPVCFDKTGMVPGIVPCVITTCRPVAHTICLRCWDKLLSLQADGKRPQCPTCRQPAAEVLPIAALVDEKADPDAARQLATVRSAPPGSMEAIVGKQKRLLQAAMLEADAKRLAVERRLQETRLDFLLKSLPSKIANMVHSTEIFWWDTLPPFENALALDVKRGGKTKSQIAADLQAVCTTLQPYVDAVCADTTYRIYLLQDQTALEGRKRAFKYLRHSVTIGSTSLIAAENFAAHTLQLSRKAAFKAAASQRHADKRRRIGTQYLEEDEEEEGKEENSKEDDHRTSSTSMRTTRETADPIVKPVPQSSAAVQPSTVAREVGDEIFLLE